MRTVALVRNGLRQLIAVTLHTPQHAGVVPSVVDSVVEFCASFFEATSPRNQVGEQLRLFLETRESCGVGRWLATDFEGSSKTSTAGFKHESKMDSCPSVYQSTTRTKQCVTSGEQARHGCCRLIRMLNVSCQLS